jgi:hypothetical protein
MIKIHTSDYSIWGSFQLCIFFRESNRGLYRGCCMKRLHIRILLMTFITTAAFFSCGPTVEMQDVPWVSGPTAPTSVDIAITTDNFAGARKIYVKVRAYSNVGEGVGGLLKSESASSTEKEVPLNSSCKSGCTVHVEWVASVEPGVNRAGGGYHVYFSDTKNFKI